MSVPLVSCIMPTRNRPEFVALAVRYFLAQDYPERELIIVDSSDAPAGLEEGDQRIRYYPRAGRLPVGSARNLAIHAAQGPIICHWDDDDWCAPSRLRKQVADLAYSGQAITGYPSMIFARDCDRKAWRYVNASANYCVGVSMMYWRRYAIEHPFDPEMAYGEDNRFVQDAYGMIHQGDANRNDIVARIHGRNTCPKSAELLQTVEFWKPVEWADVLRTGYEPSA